MDHKAHLYAIPLLSCAVLAIIISGCGLSGCSKDDAKFSLRSANIISNGTNPDAIPPEVILPPAGVTFTKLVWDAPGTYDDGSTLPDIELQEYRVYFKTESGSFSIGSCAANNCYKVSAPDLVTAPATSVLLKDVITQGTGSYVFTVTAVARTGAESLPALPPIETYILP